MQTYANIIDKIESILQDPTNLTFNVAADATELNRIVTDGLIEVAKSVPHVVSVPFYIESRTGKATATTASALVDAAESQFLSTDVGKVIYNVTDDTWAEVTAYVSAAQLTISKDIMASGDEYKIFNSGCRSNKQISISDVSDYLSIQKAKYPLGVDRNVLIGECNPLVTTSSPDIIELDMDREPDDSKVLTAGMTQPRTEVQVVFNMRHKLSQLTDLVGDVNYGAGYAAGATSMTIHAIQATGTVEAGQEFTISGVRGVYIVSADATISGNAATISFFPGLQSAVVDGTSVTFDQSTLTPQLEGILANWVAGTAASNKAFKTVNAVNVGGGSVAERYSSLGERLLAKAERDLARLKIHRVAYAYSRS